MLTTEIADQIRLGLVGTLAEQGSPGSAILPDLPTQLGEKWQAPARRGILAGMDAPEKRRRDRPCPAWLVYGSLAVTGLLFASERWRWFPFNEHKGWTVLIAMAGMGVAMALMLLWFVVALVFRWRFQFSIRSLLVLTVAVALPCSWLAAEKRRARKQSEAVAAILAEGHAVLSYPQNKSVCYDHECDALGEPMATVVSMPRIPWLHSLLGDDFFARAVWAHVEADATLPRLTDLPDLRALDLERTSHTDALLANVPVLPQLKSLSLHCSELTDAGLESVAGMRQLEALYIGQTKVTDAGLRHLEGLTRLQSLYAFDNHISDAGLQCLRGMPQLRRLNVSGTKVTDAGLLNLGRFPQLEVLQVNQTLVSDAGLKHLRGLAGLRQLTLSEPRVTPAGITELQEALPNCKILCVPKQPDIEMKDE